ncbi:MAG: Nif11-like leader peptide family natural product precursor [Bacillota bacterium]
MQEIKRFNEDVKQDEEMLEDVKKIGNDLEKIVKYANSKGYEFTVEDLENKAEDKSELSEEELEDVAGGVVCLASGKGDFEKVVGGIAEAVLVM